MIPITVWGLTQPRYNKTFNKLMSENLTLPYVMSVVKDDETPLITARTIIKIQKQIIVNNCAPNVQVIVIDESDLQSQDTDLFTSAFSNLAHLSYYSSKTYVIYYTEIQCIIFAACQRKLNMRLLKLLIGKTPYIKII